MTRRAFSVAIFARNDGAVLLVRHRRLGTWLPVGGEIEPGETPLEAAVRELREETGLAGRFPAGLGVDGTPPGLIGYEEHLAGSKGLHMNFAFVADVPGRSLAPCDEWSEARWVEGREASLRRNDYSAELPLADGRVVWVHHRRASACGCVAFRWKEQSRRLRAR
ncbi:MAG TPA: NUDIX domain-containing protein, partial [Anaeromyxobacteraceae bacterium]|nr:NUDIX domain-containing protein [Anaeromyxobacteraceae bacterium]